MVFQSGSTRFSMYLVEVHPLDICSTGRLGKRHIWEGLICVKKGWIIFFFSVSHALNLARVASSCQIRAVCGGLNFLPLVDGAVTTPEGVGLGVLNGVQNGLVFGTEVKSEHFVDLVDHFGGGGVFRGGFGVLAGRPLEAGQFLVGSRSVHDEAHAAAEVGLAQGGFLGGTGGGAHAEEAESEDDGLQDDEDEQVGQVERKHLRG